MRLTQLTEILHNPFYAGVIRVLKTGQSFAGVHRPLIPPALFERVQQILSGKAPRSAVVHDFLFRRLLRCLHCGRHLIGERQKGRVYYRCQVTGCPTTTVREDVVEAHFVELLRSLEFTSNDREEMVQVLQEFMSDEQAREKERTHARQLRLSNISDRQRRLTDAYIEGSLEKAEFEQRKTTLLLERRELDAADTTESAGVTDSIVGFLELSTEACLLYEKALPQERRELIDIMTSNRVVDGRNPRFTLSLPFADLAADAKQQSGGPPRDRARTRSTVRRLVRKLKLRLLDGSMDVLAQRVRDLLHPIETTPQQPKRAA